MDALCIVRALPGNVDATMILANHSNASKDIGFDLSELVGREAANWQFGPLWSSAHYGKSKAWPKVKNEGGVIRATIPPLACVYFQTK